MVGRLTSPLAFFGLLLHVHIHLNAHSIHIPQGTPQGTRPGRGNQPLRDFRAPGEDPHRWGMCCRFPVKFAGIQGRGCASRRFLFFIVFPQYLFSLTTLPCNEARMGTLLLILCDSPHRFRSNLLVYGKWGKLRKHSSDKDETNPLESCRQKKKVQAEGGSDW